MRKRDDFTKNGLDALLTNPIVAKTPAKPAQNVAATAKGNPKETGNGEFDEAKFNTQQLGRDALCGRSASYSGNSGTGNEKPTGEKSIISLFRENCSATSFFASLMDFIKLSNKESLSRHDILMADTNNNDVAGMRVLRVIGDNNTADQYFVGNGINNYLSSQNNLKAKYEGTTIGELQRREIESNLNKFTINDVNMSGPVALNPELVKRMHKDPKIAGYVALAQRAGAEAGIDGTMYANQLWQESRFDPKAVSPRGALGIAQMMPDKVGHYGLNNREDFYNPEKSIVAGAHMMSKLSHKYGDQRLALVAYNGGDDAINFVEKKLGKDSVSFPEWHKFMTDRAHTLGTSNKGAWHVETLDYTNKIALSAGIKTPEPS